MVVREAAQGIGWGIAARLAAEGCRVVVAEIDVEKLADDAASVQGCAALVEAQYHSELTGLVGQADPWAALTLTHTRSGR